MFQTLKYNNKGVSIIEIVVIIGVISIIFTSIWSLLSFSLAHSSFAKHSAQANVLVQEAMEATRSYRDTVPWNNNDVADEYDGLGVIDVETPYHPSIAVNPPIRWAMIEGQETIGVFTREIVFSDVYRDANDDIVLSGGSFDADTKLITASVSWQEGSRTHEVSAQMYLTNWSP